MATNGRVSPRAGEDYPRHLAEFDEFFPNEEACRRFLEQAMQTAHTTTDQLFLGTGRGRRV